MPKIIYIFRLARLLKTSVREFYSRDGRTGHTVAGTFGCENSKINSVVSLDNLEILDLSAV